MDVVKFVGIGNETRRIPALASAGFYDVKQEVFVANPLIEVPLAGPLRGRVGALFKHASSAQDSGILATRPEGTGGAAVGRARARLPLNPPKRGVPPPPGVRFRLCGAPTPRDVKTPSAAV